MTESALKIIDLLQAYPTWVKGLAVLWITITGALAVAMVIARPAKDTGENPTPMAGTKIVSGDEVHGDKVQGDKVGRQVVLPPRDTEGQIELTSFSIDANRCDYMVHRYDPAKPYWPDDADPITVTYVSGGNIRLYGRVFQSRREAEEFGDRLRAQYNHYSFSPNSSHSIYFERKHPDRPPNDNPSNLPTFYLSISNKRSDHVVFDRLEAIVYRVTPLEAIGESHTLEVLADYMLALRPYEGSYRADMIPNLKVASGDAAALRLVLLPQVSQVGGHSWLMKLKLHHRDGTLETDTFLIVM